MGNACIHCLHRNFFELKVVRTVGGLLLHNAAVKGDATFFAVIVMEVVAGYVTNRLNVRFSYSSVIY